MPVHHLAEMTWKEVRALDSTRVVAILPIGAIEAHGPHLPLATDVIIAEAMARAGAERLAARDRLPLLLPPITYSVARYAGAFTGTICIQQSTASSLMYDLSTWLGWQGVRTIAMANAHLEPAHIASIEAACAAIRNQHGINRVVFPDITKKPWALRLTDEFKSGACHAGRYEGSIVMAERPDLVRDEIRRRLEPNLQSLSKAIRAGKKSFEEAGGPEAYFGDPAAASVEEGRRTIDILGRILEEAVMEGDA